jgi:hypothetical protein
MMFKLDMTFALELIALVSGTALLMWACKPEAGCKGFAKAVGYFAVIASILTMLCTGYTAFRYCQMGFFCPAHKGMYMHGMMPGDMEGTEMMDRHMKDMMNPMMEKKAEPGKGPSESKGNP